MSEDDRAKKARHFFKTFAPRVGSKKPVSEKNQGAAPSVAQVKYYLDLCASKGQPAEDPHYLTRSQIADEIDMLKGKKNAKPKSQETPPPRRRSGRATAGAYRIQSPASHHNEEGKLF
jgi:hypothetical protein